MQLPKYIVMKVDCEPKSTTVTITNISDKCTVIEHKPSVCDSCKWSEADDDDRCEMCGLAGIDNYEPIAEQTEPNLIADTVKKEWKSWTSVGREQTEPTTEDCSMVEDEDLGVPYVEVNGKDADCPWK